MPIFLIDKIKAKNAGTFPMLDDIDLFAGWRVTADTTERDAIPAEKRAEGMQVKVVSNDKTYELKGGITNGDWVEVSSGTGTASGTVISTTEDLTIPVDYDDGGGGSVGDPPGGTVFQSQSDVDDLLTANGWTAFKHLQAVVDALPFFVSHEVTIDLASGVHRPNGSAPLIDVEKQFLPGSGLRIEGDTPSNWTTTHAGGVVRAAQVGNPDPYIDCDPATFPNDGSLQGHYAVFDNGLVGIVWEHTDTRLYICTQLNPEPVVDTTTVRVAKPNTILRNSTDDATQAYSSQPIKFTLSTIYEENFPNYVLKNVLFEDYSTGVPGTVGFETSLRLVNVMLDKTAGPLAENGEGFRAYYGGFILLMRHSFLSTPSGGADVAFSATFRGQISFMQSYAQGGDDGAYSWGEGSKVAMTGSVIRGAGGGTYGDGALYTYNGGVVNIYESGSHVRNTFIGTLGGWPALSFRGKTSEINFEYQDFWPPAIRFRDNTGPCVRIYNNVTLDIKDCSNGFLDDGGNLDVGVDVVGPRSDVFLANCDATGTNGEVRIEGVIGPYADLPLHPNGESTFGLNIVTHGKV